MNEYIKALKNGFKNPKSIFEGIFNSIGFIFLPKKYKVEIQKRREICNSCPFMSKNAVKLGIYKTTRKDEHCIQCLCNIKWKTSCLTCNCGIEKYNEKNPNTPMDLKWENIK